jgi:hypothetical protein
MSRILSLLGGAAPLDRERSAAWAALLARTAGAEGAGEPDFADGPGAAAALAALAGKGLLSFAAAGEGEPIGVFYTASPRAVASVLAADPASGFPEPVQKKQAEAFRASQGAIFRFPLAEGAEGAEGG